MYCMYEIRCICRYSILDVGGAVKVADMRIQTIDIFLLYINVYTHRLYDYIFLTYELQVFESFRS